jgi:hypothetical protein
MAETKEVKTTATTKDLYAFFKDPAEKLENKKVVVSKRFQDDDGKPVPWEIRPLSYNEVARLRAESQKKAHFESSGGKASVEIPDQEKLLLKFAVTATVFPDLNNAGLQDAYGVKGAEALLCQMLTPAELDNYKPLVQQVSGYDMGLADKVAEAKN